MGALGAWYLADCSRGSGMVRLWFLAAGAGTALGRGSLSLVALSRVCAVPGAGPFTSRAAYPSNLPRDEPDRVGQRHHHRGHRWGEVARTAPPAGDCPAPHDRGLAGDHGV